MTYTVSRGTLNYRTLPTIPYLYDTELYRTDTKDFDFVINYIAPNVALRVD